LVTVPLVHEVRLRLGEETWRALGRIGRMPTPGDVDCFDFSRTSIGDDDLARVREMPWIESLDLRATSITEVGVGRLVGLDSLHTLNLASTDATDAALRSIGRLSSLRDLDLSSTSIGDGELSRLQGLTQLERLDLRLTDATAEGMRRLTLALPKCRIEHSIPPPPPVKALQEAGRPIG
jgi:hypothetical protein